RILGHAARDKSAAIRVLACDFLISHGGDEYSDMVAKLKLDKSATVRDRMGFYERKWGNDAPKEDAL
ncbi:MAG: hypothetical protein ACPGRD_07950, partial [Planktomarina sp.]